MYVFVECIKGETDSEAWVNAVVLLLLFVTFGTPVKQHFFNANTITTSPLERRHGVVVRRSLMVRKVLA